jgi:two-component system cell cycle response regulator
LFRRYACNCWPIIALQVAGDDVETGENIQFGADSRVLIVEDDPVSALLLRNILEHKGYVVDHAENGLQALDLFKQSRHRVLISDWMMPEMDGVSLCREVRQIGGAYVYVILLSAKGQRADRLEAFEAGVDDFLTKPLDREDLFARLKVAQRIIATEERLQLQKEELSKAGERLKVANNNLVVASRRFEELFSGMPMACFTFDSNGLLHEWNRTAETLFGVMAHEALLNFVWDIFKGSSDDFWSAELVEQVFQGEAVESLEWVFQKGDRDQRHIVCNVFPLRGPRGEVLGAISANLDITERKIAERKIEEQKAALEEANERLAKLAVTDGLTGLLNHRRFQEELESCYSEHHQRQREFSLLFLDVDHFKQYNDAFGHPAGDLVLKGVAKTLVGAAEDGEVVARYGGEEFAIILPDRNKHAAIAAAERFRKAISHAEWPMRSVTASFGVATLNLNGDSAEAVIRRADAALYVSKQNGRNRVTHDQEVPKGEMAA